MCDFNHSIATPSLVTKSEQVLTKAAAMHYGKAIRAQDKDLKGKVKDFPKLLSIS